jgi:hypothetical protein
MGILSLLTYLYEIPAEACVGYLILQTFLPDPPDIEPKSKVHALYSENMY